jgi:hypothetical protein
MQAPFVAYLPGAEQRELGDRWRSAMKGGRASWIQSTTILRNTVRRRKV